MSDSIAETKVLVTSTRGGRAEGNVRIQEWGKPERTKRAAKFWAMCWALSVATVILPIAHFVLVPGFFIAGPVGAWLISRQTSVVLGGASTCPDCSQPLDIVRGPDRWPLTDMCAKCQASVTIEKWAGPGEKA